MAETRRSSILKPPKQRAPLQEVSSLNIHHQDDFTATTFTQNIMRRVSFAGTSTVKEFDTRAESVLVCHTPAYEESFAASDSSVPSDHSSRFSSRSTISTGDQSTLLPFSDGASVDPEELDEAGKRQIQNLDPDDQMLKEFGVEPLSQRTKSPTRRPRFSLGAPMDDDADSPAPKEKPSQVPTFSSSSFYGNPSPKPRPTAIPSPRSVRITIDPYTLRPQPVSSPKSQSKALNSPKSQSKVVNSPKSQSKAVNSPRSQSKAVNSPRSQSKAVNSPRSQSKAVNSPKCQSRRKSLVAGAPSLQSKSPLAKALFDPNESGASSEMELTESIPRNIFVGTPSPSSVDSAGSALTPLRNANRTVLVNDDMDLTRLDPRTPGWKNKTVYDNDMDITRAIPTRIHAANDTGVQFSDGEVHCSVQNSMTVEFSRPVSSVAISNEQHFVTGIDDGNRSVACVSRSHVTAVPVAAPITQGRLPEEAMSLSGDPDSHTGQAISQRSQDLFMKPSNTSIYDAVGMDLTEACVPIARTPLSTTLNKELPQAIPRAPLTENESFIPPLNATVWEPQGMEVTQVNPVSSKEFENNLNRTLNESMGMDLTEAIPSVPIVQDNCFSGPLPAMSPEAKTSNKLLNDTMGMDFTEAISSAPATQGFARPFPMERSSETSSDPGSHKALTSNKTLNDSMVMDFTEAISSAPATQNSIRSFPTEGSNKTLSDSVAMEFTKVVSCAPIFQENHLFPEGLEPVPDILETCDSTLNRADPRYARNTAEFPSNRANTTAYDSTGMELTKVSPTPLLEVGKSTEVVSEERKTPDPVISQPFSTSEMDDSSNADSSLAPSLQPASDSSQQTENLTLTMNENRVLIRDESGSSLPETGSLPEKIPLSDSNLARSSAPGSAALLLETPLISRPSERLTPPKRQLCRKRSYGEVGNTEEEELSARRSRLMASPLLQASTGIVIPSSRSPSPEKDDSLSRFPGLCQSFSANRTTEANVNAEPNPTLAPEKSVPEGHKLNLCSSVSGAIISTTAEEDRNPVELETPPISEVAPCETDTPISSASDGVRMDFQTPDEYNFTDISDKTKSASAEKLHKSIMDVSIPSLVDISDSCNDRDLSSGARLYATLLEAENNVAVFHKEPEVEVPLDESVRSEEAEKCGSQEGKVSVCQEQQEEQSKGSVVESRDSEANRSLPTLIPKDSPQETRPRISSLSHSAADPETSHRAFRLSRPLEQIFKEHRSEYRKRARCNWTLRKLDVNEWCFNYLEDSVELRIRVKESRSGGPSGWDGQFVSLIIDDQHGVWYIGGRLLHQKLSTDEWTSRIRETADLLSLVEDVNLVANNVELFMTHLAHLELLENIQVAHDWIRFDVLSQKTRDRWFKVTVNCRDLVNIKPHHVTIENIIGETREADIQNLVTCVKKNASFLKNYVEVVKEYLQTIERVL